MSFTLLNYRQAAALQLGPFETGTATSGSSTTIVESTAFPHKSSLSQNQLRQDQFILRPAAVAASDKVRIIASANSSTGQYTVDLAYANAPYAGGVGEAFEIHGVVEPLTMMNRLINNSLKRCFIVVEFTVTPVANAIRHSLATDAPWLVVPDWVYQVGYLESGEARATQNPFDRVIRGRTIQDGNTIYIEHRGWNFPSTGTIYIKAIKPAYNHCSTSSTFTTLQNGLSLETDVAVPDQEWVAAGVVLEAWKELGYLLDERGDQRILRDRSEAAAYFTQMTKRFFVPPLFTFQPVPELGGPLPRTSRVRYW